MTRCQAEGSRWNVLAKCYCLADLPVVDRKTPAAKGRSIRCKTTGPSTREHLYSSKNPDATPCNVDEENCRGLPEVNKDPTRRAKNDESLRLRLSLSAAEKSVRFDPFCSRRPSCLSSAESHAIAGMPLIVNAVFQRRQLEGDNRQQQVPGISL